MLAMKSHKKAAEDPGYRPRVGDKQQTPSTVRKHTRSHTNTHAYGMLTSGRCTAVTLASVIDCPPRFVCLWVPTGIPPGVRGVNESGARQDYQPSSSN